jgi:hypothetical protein
MEKVFGIEKNWNDDEMIFCLDKWRKQGKSVDVLLDFIDEILTDSGKRQLVEFVEGHKIGFPNTNSFKENVPIIKFYGDSWFRKEIL